MAVNVNLPHLDTSINENVRRTFFTLYEVLRNHGRQISSLEKKLDTDREESMPEIMASLPYKVSTQEMNHSIDQAMAMVNEKIQSMHKELRNMQDQLSEIRRDIVEFTNFKIDQEKTSEEICCQMEVYDAHRIDEEKLKGEVHGLSRDMTKMRGELNRAMKTQYMMDEELRTIVSFMDQKSDLSEVQKLEQRVLKTQHDEMIQIGDELQKHCSLIVKQVDEWATKTEEKFTEVTLTGNHMSDLMASRLSVVPTQTEMQDLLDQMQQETVSCMEEFKRELEELKTVHRSVDKRVEQDTKSLMETLTKKADIDDVNIALEQKANRKDVETCMRESKNLGKQLELRPSVQDVMMLLDAKADNDQIRALESSLETRMLHNEAQEKIEHGRDLQKMQQDWSRTFNKLSFELDNKTSNADFLKHATNQRLVNESLCNEQTILLEWAEKCGTRPLRMRDMTLSA